MPRYIDADALKLPDEYKIDPFDDPYYRGIGNGWNVALKECRERIDSATTISPDEVRGVGKWIIRKTAFGKEYTVCSACLTEIKIRKTSGEIVHADMRNARYCMACGVKMEVSE